jgi:hypothetical protein
VLRYVRDLRTGRTVEALTIRNVFNVEWSLDGRALLYTVIPRITPAPAPAHAHTRQTGARAHERTRAPTHTLVLLDGRRKMRKDPIHA